ncbi:hypothetical protein EGR_10865 [Echinococcus granulosus]|uniref:Uncharacterized protein n=1 Tax=Echinococcus granulosus TaxID=6210 RepID=W6TZU6_ECHGR|nr:hypothetical protein EGR_10865 [Echinococcus granulosus]EUB54273.1 hypothetical protein EGR_10865 [Echinococcus granulosus]
MALLRAAGANAVHSVRQLLQKAGKVDMVKLLLEPVLHLQSGTES